MEGLSLSSQVDRWAAAQNEIRISGQWTLLQAVLKSPTGGFYVAPPHSCNRLHYIHFHPKCNSSPSSTESSRLEGVSFTLFFHFRYKFNTAILMEKITIGVPNLLVLAFVQIKAKISNGLDVEENLRLAHTKTLPLVMWLTTQMHLQLSLGWRVDGGQWEKLGVWFEY